MISSVFPSFDSPNWNGDFINLCSNNPSLIEFIVENFRDKVAEGRFSSSSISKTMVAQFQSEFPRLDFGRKLERSGSLFCGNLTCKFSKDAIFTDDTIPAVERISFVEATTNMIQMLYPPQDPAPISFSSPVYEGELCSITIPEEVYFQRLETFKESFLGRVSFEGKKVVSTKDLKQKLQSIWSLDDNWRLTPFGRGCFNVYIPISVDQKRVFSKKV